MTKLSNGVRNQNTIISEGRRANEPMGGLFDSCDVFPFLRVLSKEFAHSKVIYEAAHL